MATLVICWNSYINEFRRRIGITERNHRDVDVGSFLDGLCVGAGVGDDDKTGLFEGASDVVGEVTRSEPTGDSGCPGMSSELQDSALAIWTGRDDGDVGGVIYCGDNASSKDDFLPVYCRKLVWIYQGGKEKEDSETSKGNGLTCLQSRLFGNLQTVIDSFRHFREKRTRFFQY